MKRRGIREEIVRDVLRSPGQRFDVRSGRIVLQSKLVDESKGKEYVIRVFVDIDREPPEVVTVYRTTKIVKYWKETL